MPIRTADEYRAALAHLDQERIIMRSRSFTDDEQRDFDSLTSSIAAYEAARSPGSGSAPPAAPPRPSAPVPAASASPPTLLADNMRARLSASMQQELARQGLAPAPQPGAGASTAMASMEREIRRMGLTPRGAA
ncbi:hypothetical protein C0214_13715 [Methylobacterium sp. DM1]|nr:hypothetical protein C0214_13715 [Methylobacterium sp. DM1]